MKKCIVLNLILLLSSIAQAQTTIEISKITCDQYILFKVKDPEKIAIWLSGYYHGVQKSTSLDVSLLEEQADMIRRFCYNNPKVYVMEAVQKTFSHRNPK